MELNHIHNIPCQEMFTGLTEQAALIVADPPYGIGYSSSFKGGRQERVSRFRAGKPVVRYRKEIEEFTDKTIDTSWLCPAFNALKDGGAMYLFTRWDVLHHWHTAAQEAGFKVAQRLVWDKKHWGMGDLRYYGSMTEDILFCVKGEHKLRWDKREGNIWRVFAQSSKESSDDGGYRHPTQKPSRLFDRIIQYSSDKGDLVLDPFTGSGAACIAAQRLHRRFIGCDISPTFASAAQAWIESDARTNAQVRMKPMFEAQS